MGSLFTGIGGLDLGLEWAGLGPVLWQVEIDPWRRQVLTQHWPAVDRSVIDVRRAGAASLGSVDTIAFGFPCQDISLAGRGAGLCPVRRALCECGYRTRALYVAASDCGAPLARPRLFVLALADQERRRTRVDSPGQGQRQAGRVAGPLRPAEDQRHRAVRPLNTAAEPSMGGGAHGVPAGLVRATWITAPVRWPAGRGCVQEPWEPRRTRRDVADRSEQLQALGDTVVPIAAYVAGCELAAWSRAAS